MSMATLGKFGAAQLSLSLLQAYPIGWLADRIHPLRMTIVSLFLLIVSVLVAFCLVHDATSFGISYVVCGTLTGTWATSAASLPAVLFGRPKFAMLNSAWLMSGALGTTVAGPACGWMLDLRHHDYRYTFLWAGLVGLAAFAVTLVVYWKFRRYGGPDNYMAPE
jgi:MFS family permease